MQRKLEKLATRDDIAQTQKQHYPKDCDQQRIESLKRLLHRQQAIHEDNNNMLKQLKDNLHYQNNVLFSVFICFVLAVLCLCLYNVFYVFLIVFIGFHLYYLCTLSYSWLVILFFVTMICRNGWISLHCMCTETSLTIVCTSWAGFFLRNKILAIQMNCGHSISVNNRHIQIDSITNQGNIDIVLLWFFP